MKHVIQILIAGLMLLSVGCASTADNTQRDGVFGSEVDVDRSGTTLDVYLSRLSGIRVTGAGRTADVRISGYASSVDSRPLFIIDGSRMGRDFRQIYDMVDMSLVDKVRVLRSPRATTLYGEDGKAGAILITFKNRD